MTDVSGFSSWVECAYRTAFRLNFGTVVGERATVVEEASFHTSKDKVDVIQNTGLHSQVDFFGCGST